ncbi:MAG TPA: YfhO family protein [Candidatus Eisenbacteria bacterium]|nr:YfhO family protein [Candidatus Eisenbacteria bacterium]
MTPAKKKAPPPRTARGSARPSALHPGGGVELAWRWAILATLLLVLLFFYPIVIGKVFLSPDSVAPAGFSKIANEALHERGVYALWNPYYFLGMPSYGSLAYHPYVYPPDLIVHLLNQIGFPDLTWLLGHYLLLALSMLVLLRALGADSGSAAFGAITLALTPNLVAVGAFGHGSQIMTAAYLPLLVWLLDRFTRKGSWLALAGFATAAAFQLLRGHVQIVFYSWIALGLYALVFGVAALRAGRKAEGLRAFGGLAAGLLLGFGMSAFLYLPIHEYSRISTRGGGEGGGAGLEYATSWSFHPREMLTFVLPGMFGFGGQTYWGTMPFTDYPNYMGIVPLALAIVGAARARGPLRVYLVLLALASLLISFGKHFQALYSLLYFHLPFFNKFRVPVMILVLVQFAAATLAALGLTAALRPEPRPAKGADPGRSWIRGSLLALAGGVGALVLLNVFAPSIRSAAVASRPNFDMARARAALDMASIDAIKGGLFLAAALAVIGFARRGRIGRAWAAFLVIGITALDLWTIDRKIMDPLIGSPVEYDDHFRETPEVAFLRSDSTQFRVFPLEWNDSRLAAFGIASVLGYHPAKPRLYQAFVDTAGIQSIPTLRMLNVKYVLVADGEFPPGFPGVALRHDGPVKVYEILDALPRAGMMHSVRQVRDDGVALAIMRTQNFDPRAEVLWNASTPAPPMAFPYAPESVRTVTYDFNEIEYRVRATAPGLLLAVEQWDPDWRATVNGKEAPIHRVNFFMRAVALPAGEHVVRFTYHPAGLEAGWKITIAAAGITLALAVWGIVSGRRRRAAAADAGPPGPAEPLEGPAT